MSLSLRAFQPDQDTTQSFRDDGATIRQVLDWYEQDQSRPTIRRSPGAEAERRRIWRVCRESLGSSLTINCKPFHLLNLINAQRDVKSDWTRKRWNNTIQRPFNRAERLGLIVKNPFRGLSFPDGEQGRDWTPEELSQVLRGANRQFRLLIIGLRLSGLRPDEGCELQWPHILPSLGMIKIEDHKTRYITKSARCVPLNAPMIKLFAWIKRQKLPGKYASKYVFLNTKGKPWTRTHADSSFRRLRKRLGLAEDLKLHGCRHTFGTNAIINGVDVAELMQLLGHLDIRTTQRYVHLAGKVDHLAVSMDKAVQTKPRLRPKAVEIAPKRRTEPHPTPLFDGLE